MSSVSGDERDGGANDDDARSVFTTSSELSPNAAFTQEEIDCVRGFVQTTRDLEEHRKKGRDLQKTLKKHREVLVGMLKTRKKTKLKLEGDLKIQLVTSTTQKKPPVSKMFEMVQSTLRSEAAEAYTRVFPKIEQTMRESETVVEKEKLVLEEPGKTKTKSKRAQSS